MTLQAGAIERAPRVREVSGITPERFRDEIASGYQPVVMRGLAANWPAVAAAKAGTEAMAQYLLRFDRGSPAEVMVARPEVAGRFFYDEQVRGFNFERAKVALPVLVAELLRQAREPKPAALYAGSASAPDKYPGWAEENVLPLDTPGGTPRVWLGNSSRVSTHYDVSDNIAVVAAGRRRFALFPPEQAANLYVGPLDVTLAGQPVSMVDLEAPDLDRYPRFADALPALQVAELEPGDAIYVPSLWWHDVRASGPLNVLVNYWWGQSSADSPFPALVHAMLTVRDLRAGERAAMRAWFDHFVFGEDAATAGEHLPPHARGPFAAPSAARDSTTREYLIRTLARAGPSVTGATAPGTPRSGTA